MRNAVNAVLQLQCVSGAIEKKKIIEENKGNERFCKLLYYALHPLLTYKVSERTLRKPMPHNAAITLTMTNIFEVCEALAQRKALDDATVYQVKGFLAGQPDEYRELYTCIVSKTLRLGVTAKTVNKVIPGLIPEWEVQQAYPIDKYPIKDGVCFRIFDAIPSDEFANGESKQGYKSRRALLDELKETDLFKDAQYIKVLDVLYQGTDQTKIDELLEQMVREDKEGLMANLDVPYKCKRHNGILKIKRFYTMDLPIVRCEEGSGRLSGTLGALVLNYKGNEVNVGTGFTDTERAIYWAAREKLTDLLCEVKYKEISYDKKTGAESLQFPVYVCLRTDKSETSYG